MTFSSDSLPFSDVTALSPSLNGMVCSCAPWPLGVRLTLRISFPFFSPLLVSCRQNKEFVCRGHDYERLEAFQQRMLNEFPHAIAMQHVNQPDQTIYQADAQCILGASVATSTHGCSRKGFYHWCVQTESTSTTEALLLPNPQKYLNACESHALSWLLQ